LVEALMNGNQFQVTIYGAPAPSYTLQSTTSLRPPIAWSPVWTGALGSNLFQVIPLPITNAASFFRASMNPVLRLDAQLVSGQFQLLLRAPPGSGYALESTPDLTPPLIWSPFWSGAVGSSGVQLIPVPTTNSRMFFRAHGP